MPDWRINESVRLIRPIFTIKKVVIFAPNESPALTIYSAVDRNVAATVQIRGGIKRIVIKTARIYELHYETCAKHFLSSEIRSLVRQGCKRKSMKRIKSDSLCLGRRGQPQFRHFWEKSIVELLTFWSVCNEFNRADTHLDYVAMRTSLSKEVIQSHLPLIYFGFGIEHMRYRIRYRVC